MNITLCILISVVSATIAQLDNLNTTEDSPRVVGGYPVKIGKPPYQVSLRYKWQGGKEGYQHFCGGSIYSPLIIITAAHCMAGKNPRAVKVSAGISNVKEKGISIPVKQIIAHEDYDVNFKFDMDIALLVLDSKLPFNLRTIKPIQLQQSSVEGKTGMLTGWGRTYSTGPASDELRALNIPVVNNEKCKEVFKRLIATITSSMFCAGFTDDTEGDSCQGDSGGPLAVNGKLAGIVSWGHPVCATPGFPGIYTNISYLYPWIIYTIQKLNLQEHR